MKIDAHQHFWKYDSVRDSWITDEMKVIQRDFLPEDLQPILVENKIDACVAVQADQSEEETYFLLGLSEKFDVVAGIVAWVDLQAANVFERLDEFSKFEKIKGFRHVVQGEKDPEFMLRPAFRKGITALESCDFTYDILIYHHQLDQANQLVKFFPNQKFVLDHIAKPNIKDGEINEWKINIKKLAFHENVFCKVSGMVTEADWNNWKQDDFNNYLDVVFSSFGTDRIMYGSDWPVCLLAAKYDEQLSIVKNYISKLNQNEQAKVLGLNAQSFYQL
jgi:L-fuconolactonase